MLYSSLEKCNFVITNVHQLYKSNENSLLNRVKPDFFDMIIIDEAHHSAADTWKDALEYFKSSKKLHLTGTPYRGDGQEIPGVEIHKTSLSEVMKLKYVKWLRKQTLNNKDLYFTISGETKKYTKDEILKLKDKEWIEKSVALAPECSEEIIKASIENLKTLKETSPKVSHKILAVACSIAHAEDIATWYEDHGKKTVIVHSEMNPKEKEQNFLKIEENLCEVVVSVNMLMEGYDHKYLTILSIFRPFRSLNAFAQVIGRVLRAIPEDEITDFAIDNNALVLYHQEIGLDTLWEIFQKEINKAKKHTEKEYIITDREYIQKENELASIETGNTYSTTPESYIEDINFNELFEKALADINEEVDSQIDKLPDGQFDKDIIEELKKLVKKQRLEKKSSELDTLLFEKRPEQARQQMKGLWIFLKKKILTLKTIVCIFNLSPL